jgi:hypothetical protein
MDDKTFFNRPISSQGSKVAAVTPHDTDDLELVDLGEDAGIKKAPVLYITTGGLLKFLPIQNDPADRYFKISNSTNSRRNCKMV